MPWFDIDTDSVYRSGTAVRNESDDALDLATDFLSKIQSAEGVVVHETVKTALASFYDQWDQPVRDLANEIDTLGSNTSASATTTAEGDAEANGSLTQGGAPTVNLAGEVNSPIMSLREEQNFLRRSILTQKP